ncbi:hypothetical protein CRE_26206 [Caenorhabditis remanei]|uniref:Uncharacterized protein n=2 Tax=Caenorhabditis remanei TaxID=31234 RepID=E3LQQ9_CAERE|nr:hypothetical protein CRE_26200 [Caenorhabditis remanei]EFP07654.1 hypothetical protein CRE_26206 [Caenorhabditis remanei]
MMRKSAGYEAKAYTSEDAEIPRKCVVIHKKKIGNTMEKIELRYVAYNRIENGVHSTTMEVINDASTYFKDRAEDLDYQNDSSSQSSLQKTVTIAKSEEKEKKNKEKLEQCLPLLMKIRARFEENEKNSSYSAHNRSQNGALKVLCDEIVAEATYEINNGHPISSDLIKKIANINTLSRQVIAKESKLESLVPDENELAASKSKTSDKFAK